MKSKTLLLQLRLNIAIVKQIIISLNMNNIISMNTTGQFLLKTTSLKPRQKVHKKTFELNWSLSLFQIGIKYLVSLPVEITGSETTFCLPNLFSGFYLFVKVSFILWKKKLKGLLWVIIS